MLSKINWSLGYLDLFPSLLESMKSTASHNRLCDALDLAAEADCDEKITASQLSTVKDTVGRAVERLWDEKIYEAHLLPMYRQEASDHRQKRTPLMEVFHYRNVHSLHDVLSVPKKIATARKKGEFTSEERPLVEALESFQKEILPLAELAGVLKKNIYKKEAVARPKSTNLHQVRGNCSCCKSDVAVDGGSRMAHHGYQWMDGFQSDSCFGRAYPPLQTSDEGLRAWKDNVEKNLEANVRKLEKSDDITLLRVPCRGGSFITVQPFNKEWDKELKKYKTTLTQKISRLQGMVASLSEDIENWKTQWEGKPLRDVYGNDIKTAPEKTLKPSPAPGM